MKRVLLTIAALTILTIILWVSYCRQNKITQTYIDLETNRKVIAEYNNQGELDGESLVYVDKKLIASAQFKEGLKNGVSIKYYSNGTKESVTPFVNDKEEGKRTVYYPNGTIKLIEEWNSGKLYGNSYFYFDNGRFQCYKARDILETVFYLYELNKAGEVKKNYGRVFSENIYSRVADSFIVLKPDFTYKQISDIYILLSLRLLMLNLSWKHL